MLYSSQHDRSPSQSILPWGVLALALIVLIFVKPNEKLGPLKVPRLSLIQIRLIAGGLLAIAMISIINYYVLDPGYFQSYKRHVLGALFAVALLFAALYGESSVEMMKNGSEKKSP